MTPNVSIEGRDLKIALVSWGSGWTLAIGIPGHFGHDLSFWWEAPGMAILVTGFLVLYMGLGGSSEVEDGGSGG